MARPPAYEQAYPQTLWEHERAHLRARMPERHRDLADRPSDQVIGVALSGGGIRSATFCLGVFQALAELRRLSRIDYLSTVSGGGYFGTFLGRLYRRDEVENDEQVRAMLDPTAPPGASGGKLPNVVAWLRENGRYLSPNGAGDLLIGAAIMLRNWITIQVVLLSFVLLVMLVAQLPRVALEVNWCPALVMCQADGWLWWSPWLYVPGLTVAFWATPLAWAFWLTGRWRNRSVLEWPIWGVVLTAVVAVGVMIPEWAAGFWWVGVGTLLTIAATLVAWVCARGKARRGEKDIAFPSEDTRRVYEVDRQRNFLSTQLKFALVATAGLLAFALVDSLGQTLYLLGHRPESSLFSYLGSALGVMASAVAFVQRIATALAGKANGGRMRLPVAAVVTAAALAVTLLLLVSLSVVAHAVLWRLQAPVGAPGITWTTPTPARAVVNVRIPEGRDGAVTATAEVPVRQPRPACAPCRGSGDLLYLGIVCAILFAFGFAFGRCWPFINQSSLHSMYSARLTRAYLGASNPRRRRLGNERITEVVPGDNIDPSDYWPGPDERGVRSRPLHLINVTVNETVDGRSNVQRQDRKGTGLAIGPCAFSVGIRHHAVFRSHAVLAAARRGDGEVTVFPKAAEPSAPIYQVFAGDRWAGGEALSVGAWTGISGAAFSTGLGARTSLGLSLLCGLTNVRLGYWWKSGADPAKRPGRLRRSSFLERMFPVQSFLLSEFLSRFYGTTRWHWYLSDGGHFENMGGYELIRRRLERIVLVDAEADPEYTFDGLANLVRKARVDFGAEIEFLREDELNDEIPAPYRRLFGTLAQLRRGKWNEEPVLERLPRPPERRRLSVEEPIDQGRHSLAHAALARVSFIDDPGWEGWLLYLKPTLLGDEPTDLVQYHGAHPAFPQETTADQFFDEAQWESYRMLGYHIARDVFAPAPRDLAAGATTPADRMFGR